MSDELTEHLRRSFTREMRSSIATAEAHAAADLDPTRRKAHKTHAEALRRALMTYTRTWGKMAPKVVEGNR